MTLILITSQEEFRSSLHISQLFRLNTSRDSFVKKHDPVTNRPRVGVQQTNGLSCGWARPGILRLPRLYVNPTRNAYPDDRLPCPRVLSVIISPWKQLFKGAPNLIVLSYSSSSEQTTLNMPNLFVFAHLPFAKEEFRKTVCLSQETPHLLLMWHRPKKSQPESVNIPNRMSQTHFDISSVYLEKSRT